MTEVEDSDRSCLTDVVGVGVLTRLVPREVVVYLGRKEQRDRRLPARVMVYFVMAMALFYGDGYEEVMRKVVAGLRYIGYGGRPDSRRDRPAERDAFKDEEKVLIRQVRPAVLRCPPVQPACSWSRSAGAMRRSVR